MFFLVPCGRRAAARGKSSEIWCVTGIVPHGLYNKTAFPVEKGEKKKIQFRQYEYFCDETCIFYFERGKDRNKKIKEIAFSGGEGSKS